MALGILSRRDSRDRSRPRVFLGKGSAAAHRPDLVEGTWRCSQKGLPRLASQPFLHVQLPGSNRDDLRSRRTGVLDVGLSDFSKTTARTRYADLWRNHGSRRLALDLARRICSRPTAKAL